MLSPAKLARWNRCLRHVHDVALVGLEHLHSFDVVSNLSEQDEPELGAFRMEMAALGEGRRRNALSEDDVRDRAIVVYKTARVVLACNDSVEIDIRLIAFGVGALARARERAQRSNPASGTGFTSIGYIFRAFAMFTSYRSEGRSPTVSISYMVRYGT